MVLTTVLATLAWEKLEDHCVFSPKHRYNSLSFTSVFFVKEWRLDTSENGGAGNSTFLAFIKTVIKYREIQKKKISFFWYSHPSLEKAMATHSSSLAWKLPWTEKPGGLQSMGSQRIGHHWMISLTLFTFMHWRRKWQPTPVFLPGESQGWRSLVGCRLWGCTESDTTEAT